MTNLTRWRVRRAWNTRSTLNPIPDADTNDVKRALRICMGLKGEEAEAYIDKLIANGVTVTMTDPNGNINSEKFEITPPRVDILDMIVRHAVTYGFVLRGTNTREGRLDLLNIKKGVQIQDGQQGIVIYVRRGRGYKKYRAYDFDNVGKPASNPILNRQAPYFLSLSNQLLRDIEIACGDEIGRDDLFQNMIAQEVRDCLFDAHVKCGLNRARNEKEFARLRFKGTFKCVLDESVEFKADDSQHKGTFTISFAADGDIRVLTQLQFNRRIKVSPECPEYTPENIAAWIKRCAEADVKIAIMRRELREETERIAKSLEVFVNDSTSV